MPTLQRQLDREQLPRISRSPLVDPCPIRELQPVLKGEPLVASRSAQRLPMARGRREIANALRRS